MTHSEEGSLFAHLGKHESFAPEKIYPPMNVRQLAAEATINEGNLK